MKKKGLISFSGGETSGYMLWWLLNHKKDEYDFTVTFANTGRENQETLDFVKKCGEYFGVEIIWLEAVIRFKIRYYGKFKTFLSFEEKDCLFYKIKVKNYLSFQLEFSDPIQQLLCLEKKQKKI